MKKRVVIIGAGFAGLSAAYQLSMYRDLCDVTLIDKHENTHFRPLIADVVSQTVYARHLLYPLTPLKERYGFHLYCEPARSIDFENRCITLSEHLVNYDYLIIAAGSRTSLPPTEELRKYALTLDTIHDANRVGDAVFSRKFRTFLVCGGGYTGVELATHLWKAIQREAISGQIVIVEMMNTLIGTLPVWMQHYVTENVKRLGIQLRLGTKVDSIIEKQVRLSNGEILDDALCIWTTGLEAPPDTSSWDLPRAHRGAIGVDATLRFRDTCFAAGDMACVTSEERCLRKAVQFSIDEGRVAALNTVALIRGEKPSRFRARDPGFIVPMANGRSCGEVFGFRMRGYLPTMLHYMISAYRSIGIQNRLGVIFGAVKTARV